MLSGSVDEILTALNPQEADAFLRTQPVTHVICDHWFGHGQPLGVDVAAGWRDRHQSIAHVVVLTGRDIEQINRPEAVDEIVPKTATKEMLLAALGLG